MLEPSRPHHIVQTLAEARAVVPAAANTFPGLRLIACQCMASERERIDRYVAEGPTVAGHLRAIGWPPSKHMHARVMIDGHLIPEAQWEYIVPRANQSLVIRVIPMGGDSGKTALRIVGMLAIVVAAAYTGGGALSSLSFLGEGLQMGLAAGTAGAYFAAGVVSIAGTLAMSAHIPAPLPRRALPVPIPDKTLKEAA